MDLKNKKWELPKNEKLVSHIIVENYAKQIMGIETVIAIYIQKCLNLP